MTLHSAAWRRMVAAFVAVATLLAMVIISGVASHQSAWAGELQGFDIGSKVTSLEIKKKVNGSWVDAVEITPDDDVRVTVQFVGAETQPIRSNGNKAYIKVDGPADCSSFAGKSYELTDSAYSVSHDGTPGNYEYVKQGDNWYIVLTFNDAYLGWGGQTIQGSVYLNMKAAQDQYPSDGKSETITIGEKSGQVTVKPGKDQQGGDGKGSYNLQKSASNLHYSEDSKTAYYDYTVTLTVNKDVTGPIEMKDTLTGKGWSYVEGSWKVSGDNAPSISPTVGANDSGATASIIIGENGKTIKAGTYTITYSTSTSIESSKFKSKDGISNKVEISGSDAGATIWPSSKTQTINKSGNYADGEITWTVTLNKGDIVQFLDQSADFTDTIPDGLELEGNVTVTQYNADGSVAGSSSATVADGKTISYSTPTGQYYYVITYKTKVSDDASIPIGGKEFTNTGKTTGGLEGTSDGKVTVPNHVVDKQRVSQDNPTSTDGKTTANVHWKTTINVNGSLDGYTYDDYAGTYWSNILNKHVNPMSMSDAQRNAIVVKGADGKALTKGTNYTVSASDHTENGIATGLFKIIFKEVTGPVTIEYETTVDGSMLNGQTARNVAYVTDGKGHSDTDEAYTETIQVINKKDLIWKFSNTQNDGDASEKNIDLEVGQALPWTLWLNKGKTLTGDLTVVDTLPEGVKFDESSLKIAIASDGNVYGNVGTWGTLGDSSKVTYQYDSSTRQLTLRIPKEAYVVNGQSLMIFVTYSTPVTDASGKGFSDNDRLKFTNKASLEQNGETADTSFTENVKRTPVAKHGSYDQINGKLNYTIPLNPDGATLNGGSPLTVTDTLQAGSMQSKVKLDSVKLFTAVTVDGTIQAGTWVKDLQLADNASVDTYTYDEANNKFETKIADSTAYVLETTYSVSGADDVADDIQVTNTVKLSGNQEWNKSDQSTKIEAATGGSVSTGDHILLIKHDKAYFEKKLSSAKFTLEALRDGIWMSLATLTTNDQGQALYPSGQENVGLRQTLYRLTEIQAPDGYELDSTPYYFYVIDEDATFDVPESIEGDQSYEPSNVVAYKLPKNQNAMLTIDRYDEEEVKPNPGQIKVTKVWKDKDGQEVTDPVALSKMVPVQITLTKTVTAEDGSVTTETVGTKELSSDNNWVCEWNDLSAEENIKYSVIETLVDGYRATYKLNGEASAGTNFSLEQDGDLVTVTNTPASASVELPSTGGMGDAWFIGGGVLTVLVASFGLAESLKNAKRSKVSQK